MSSTVWVVKKDHSYYIKGSSPFNYALAEPINSAYIFYCKETAEDVASKIRGAVVKCSKTIKECKGSVNPVYVIKKKDKYMKDFDGVYTDNIDEAYVIYIQNVADDIANRMGAEAVNCSKIIRELKS